MSPNDSKTITLHPKKMERIDQLGRQLIEWATPSSMPAELSAGVVAYITDKGYGSRIPQLQHRNPYERDEGTKLLIYVLLETGLWEDVFAEHVEVLVDKIVGHIVDGKDRRLALGKAYAESLTNAWFYRMLFGLECGSLAEYVQDAFNDDVQYRVYAFAIKGAVFRSGVEFEDIFINESTPDEITNIENHGDHRALSYLTLTVLSDHHSGISIATDRALAFMDILHVYYPQLRNDGFNIDWNLSGREYREKIYLLEISPEQREHTHYVPRAMDELIEVPPKDLQSVLLKDGFDNACRLVLSGSHNSFHDKLVLAIKSLAKARTCRSITEKLIYTIAMLESLFAEGKIDSISYTIGDRFAFYVADNKEDRMQIILDFKKAYSYRSRFVHQNLWPSNDTFLTRFFYDARRALIMAVQMREDFETHADFVRYVSGLKYG